MYVLCELYETFEDRARKDTIFSFPYANNFKVQYLIDRSYIIEADFLSNYGVTSVYAKDVISLPF